MNLCIAILNSTSKNALSLFLLLMSSKKLEIREEQVLPGSGGGVWGWGAGIRMAQIVYAHVDK
jgi:hypothetical protein